MSAEIHPLPAVAALEAPDLGALALTAPPSCPCVYIANHRSHLDAVVLWRRARRSPPAGGRWRQDTEQAPGVASPRVQRHLIERGSAPTTPLAEQARRWSRPPPRRWASATVDLVSRHAWRQRRAGGVQERAPRPCTRGYSPRSRPTSRIHLKGEVAPVPLLASVTFGAAIELQAGEDKEAFLARARAAVTRLRQT
jgi:hypothetical protein